MGAISKSEPISSEFVTINSMFGSISRTKIHNGRIYISTFVGHKHQIGWNIYMKAISKSEPILSKLSRVISMLKIISRTKFLGDRIYITALV